MFIIVVANPASVNTSIDISHANGNEIIAIKLKTKRNFKLFVETTGFN
jgi:hypothetical protein